MVDEGEDKSEWNEQQKFSDLYFDETKKCREAHSKKNLNEWVAHVECKMILSLAIQDKPEVKESIKEARKSLLNMHGRYVNANGSHISREANNLYEALFEVESDIDTLTNAKMPFLRLAEKFDVEDF